MTTREKYQTLHKTVGTTAKIISNTLNAKGLMPLRSRVYSRVVVHQVLWNGINDPNIIKLVDDLYKSAMTVESE